MLCFWGVYSFFHTTPQKPIARIPVCSQMNTLGQHSWCVCFPLAKVLSYPPSSFPSLPSPPTKPLKTLSEKPRQALAHMKIDATKLKGGGELNYSRAVLFRGHGTIKAGFWMLSPSGQLLPVSCFLHVGCIPLPLRSASSSASHQEQRKARKLDRST